MAVVDQQLADTATAARNAPVLELRLRPAIDLSREQFFQLCQLNRDVRIERNAEGSIALMPPTGGETGARSGRLFAAVFGWADEDGTSAELYPQPTAVDGEGVLPGFVLNLAPIWESAF